MQHGSSRARRTKGDAHDPTKGKAKFVEQRNEEIKLSPIKPLNQKQRNYIELLESKDVVVATGFAGTSKTFLPTSIGCDLLRTGKIEKLIFCRPPISNSKSLGYFSGSAEEKASYWLSPVIQILKERLGIGGLEVALKKEDVVYQPLETIKGSSFNNAWIIVDEAEDLTVDEIKKLITRIGKNSKMIFAGDITQSELKGASGLKWLVDFSKRHELNDFFGFVDFNHPNDIVRSEAVKKFIVCLERDNREAKNND